MINIKNIDIALDSYDDLFSDFDISSYAKRELSEDFVKELIKRASTEQYDSKSFQITLSIPASKRDQSAERIIHRRIKQHFVRRVEALDRDIKAHQNRGIKYIIIGSLIIIFDIFLPTDVSFVYAISNILLVAGWFGVWTGIAKILDEPTALINQRKLFSLLASAHYQFVNEEDIMIMRQVDSIDAIIKETAPSPALQAAPKSDTNKKV